MISKNEILHSFSHSHTLNKHKNIIYTSTQRSQSLTPSHVHIVRIGECPIHSYTIWYMHIESKFIVRSTDGHIDCVQLFSDSQLCSFSNLSKFAQKIIKLGEKSNRSPDKGVVHFGFWNSFLKISNARSVEVKVVTDSPIAIVFYLQIIY